MSPPSEAQQREALEVAKEIAIVEVRIAELEATKARLNTRFFSLIGGSAPTDKSTRVETPPAETNGETRGDSSAGRVLAFFKERPGKRIKLEVVTAELSDIEPTLIRTAASRLARKAKERGKGYGLKRLSQGEYKYIAREDAVD